MASQLAFKSRIASTASLEKIFNAQEMIGVFAHCQGPSGRDGREAVR